MQKTYVLLSNWTIHCCKKHTTLIFGNNMDNDSQGSNGSGKSAMLEAIAIGITGETLRRIKMDEIINDAEDEATVSLLFQKQYYRTVLIY